MSMCPRLVRVHTRTRRVSMCTRLCIYAHTLSRTKHPHIHYTHHWHVAKAADNEEREEKEEDEEDDGEAPVRVVVHACC